MQKPQIYIAADENELSRKAAEAVVADAGAAAGKGRRFTIALSGGKTPEKLYRTLAAPPFADRMPWDKVHLFMGDERFVPPDHADSNFRMVRESLLTKAPLPPSHVHAVPTQCQTAAHAAEEYERMLKFFFGGVDFPRFDVVLLGLGEDGHTASLFPGAPALDEKNAWTAAVKPPSAPHDRVTLTFPVLNNARKAVFLVAGAKKAAIVKEILQGPPGRYPAQRIKPANGTLEWRLDRAASPQGR